MYACPYIIVSLSVRQVPGDLLCSRNARSWKDGKGSLIVLLLAEQVRGWGLMIFCARATRGRRLPSLDARNGRSISPTPDGTTSELGGSSYIVRRAQGRIDQATLEIGLGIERTHAMEDQSAPIPEGTACELEGSESDWRIEVGGMRREKEPLISRRERATDRLTPFDDQMR